VDTLTAAPSLTATLRGRSTARVRPAPRLLSTADLSAAAQDGAAAALSMEQRLAANIVQPEIKAVALRYLALVATTLRPWSRSTESCPRSGGPDPGASGQRYAAAVVACAAQGPRSLSTSPGAGDQRHRRPLHQPRPPGGLLAGQRAEVAVELRGQGRVCRPA
jgi:hypothetical protein